MLNIAICDDDIQTTGRMETMIRKIAKRNFTNAETEVFWDGRSLADAVMEGSSFDIIYLDIEMDKEEGNSAEKMIRQSENNYQINYLQILKKHMPASIDKLQYRK